MSTTEARPRFVPELLIYEREEKEGFHTFVPRLHPETMELVVNGTAWTILNLCDGNRALSDITRALQELYPDVSAVKLESDALKTIAMFSRLSVIEWDGENPLLFRREEPASDGHFLRIAQENDIVLIHQFLARPEGSVDGTQVRYSAPGLGPQDYSEVSLRHKLFSYSEEFFLLLREGGVAGLVSIGLPATGDSVGLVRRIDCPSSHLREVLEYAHLSCPYFAIKDLTKVRLVTSSVEGIPDTLRQALEDCHYREEATLQHELGPNVHARFFAYSYSPEFMNHLESLRRRGEIGSTCA